MIGRPLGDEAFLDAISRRLNRVVTPRKRGRKPKGDGAGAEAKGQRRACHRNPYEIDGDVLRTGSANFSTSGGIATGLISA
ncbi:MAG: hypothetical protein WB677_18035 [Xanthobacteraceae bacterium]